MPEIRPKDMMPEPTLGRLPWYLAYVSMLRTKGVEHVSSTQISKEIDVDASRIAKDLSFLDIKGKTRSSGCTMPSSPASAASAPR